MSASKTPYLYPQKEVSWTTRDTLLFHMSIGISSKHLHLLWEGHPGYQVFPTFPTVLAYKGTEQDVVDFLTVGKPTDLEIPGVPKFDRSRVVDAQKRIITHRALPSKPSSQQSFVMRQELTGLYDKGASGTIIETSTTLLDRVSGVEYATIIGSVMARGQGGWGGPPGPASKKFPIPLSRKADCTHVYQTSSETPLLYRLNGDYNPLHAEPSAGQKMGFRGVILHGLFTWNLAAYAVNDAMASMKPSRMLDFQARFAAPVFPGDTLTTHMWKVASGGASGVQEVLFVVKNQHKQIVLSNGKAIFGSGLESNSKL